MATETRVIPRLLTVADLAERWSCDESTVLDHVRAGGLFFVPVGKKPSEASRPGPKAYRFRLADVEAWEEARRMDWSGKGTETTPTPPPVAPAHTPAGVPGWDGKVRGGRKSRR